MSQNIEFFVSSLSAALTKLLLNSDPQNASACHMFLSHLMVSNMMTALDVMYCIKSVLTKSKKLCRMEKSAPIYVSVAKTLQLASKLFPVVFEDAVNGEKDDGEEDVKILVTGVFVGVDHHLVGIETGICFPLYSLPYHH